MIIVDAKVRMKRRKDGGWLDASTEAGVSVEGKVADQKMFLKNAISGIVEGYMLSYGTCY